MQNIIPDFIYYEEIVFTIDECKKIIKLSEEINEFYDSSQEKIPNVRYYKKIIKNTKNTNWIFEKLIDYFIEKTNVSLNKEPEELFVVKYEKECAFALHNDGYGHNRIWSLVVQLGEDYNGGDLYLHLDKKIKINKSVGNCLIFRPEVWHEVTKITQGTRWSLIFFLNRDNITQNNLNKSLQ